MTKREYNACIKALKERGYKFVDKHYRNCRYYYYKVIEHRQDEYGNSRAICQLLFDLYEVEDNTGHVYYSIEPVAIVSRYTTERFDFAISNPKRSIDECERLAQEFMKFIDDNIPNS